MTEIKLDDAVDMVQEFVDENLSKEDVKNRVTTILAKGEFDNFMVYMKKGLSFCDLSAAHQIPKHNISLG